MGALIVVSLVVLVGLACGLQRSLIYPRPAAPERSPAERRADVRVLWVGEAGDVEAWFLPPRNAVGPAPVLVFTHGNGELIDHWLDEFEAPRDWGVGVLLVEYPGYGRSGGAPSERAITAAMASAYDAAIGLPEVDAGRVVAYGRSLGGGAACALVRQRAVAALVLESSFTSVRKVAGFFGPIVLDPFENLDTVAAFAGPTLIVHGEHDRVIPVAHGRALAERAQRAELHVLACGHNDCPRPYTQLRGFLHRNGLLGETAPPS